jgi:hypothetical protein
MTLLGRLLNNRRAGDAHTAWNLPNLQGPELLTLTSRHFADGGTMPLENCAKTIGGDDLSPHLAWTPPPSGTAQLLLVAEVDERQGAVAVGEAGGLPVGEPDHRAQPGDLGREGLQQFGVPVRVHGHHPAMGRTPGSGHRP